MSTHAWREFFDEAFLRRLEPDWRDGNLACHTYNFNDRVEVTDGLRRA
jgi:hypothetical protein